MAFSLAVGNLVEFTVVSSAGTQFAANVGYLEVTATAGTGMTDAQLATAMDVTISALMKPIMSNQAIYEGIRLQIVGPVRRPRQVAQAMAGVGTSVADLMSPQTAGLVAYQTAIASKSTRGRKFFPFPSEAQNGANGKPTAGYLTALTAAASIFTANATWGGGGNTVTTQGVIYSRKFATTSAILGFTTRPSWATMRRRSFLNKGDSNPLT